MKQSNTLYRDWQKKAIKIHIIGQKLKKAKVTKKADKSKSIEKIASKKTSAVQIKMFKNNSKEDKNFLIYAYKKEWANLFGKCNIDGDTPKSIIEDCIADKDIFRILYVNKKRAGMIHFTKKTATIGHIWALYVHHNFRLKGYAHSLLKAAEKSLTRRKAKKVTLEVWSYNKGALEFFKKAQYIKKEKNKFGRRLILLEKKLK